MADHIVTFETWQSKDGKPRDASLLAFIARYCAKTGVSVPPANAIKGAVQARVNQGRWLVDCPVAGCGNAIMASYQEPIFFCHICGNVDNPAHWYKVIFPQERKEIEAALLGRPSKNPFNAPHRNWIPGESVAKLQKENTEHKVEVKL